MILQHSPSTFAFFFFLSVAPRILAFLMNQALIETTHSSAMALTLLIAPCHIVLVLRYPTHPAGLMYYYYF